MPRQAEHRDSSGIHHGDVAAGDRANRVFLIPRSAKLPDDEYVERRVERGSNLVRHWHSSAGQRKDDDVRARHVTAQPLSEDLSGLAPVPEELRHASSV